MCPRLWGGLMRQLTPSGPTVAIAERVCGLLHDASVKGLLVLATATSLQAIHPLLRTKHVFGETEHIPLPDRPVRQRMLHEFAPEMFASMDAGENVLDFATLAGATDGYSPADLKDLVEEALRQAILRDPDSSTLTEDDFSLAHLAYTPASLRGAAQQRPEVSWSDIGGLQETRRLLRETLEWPTKYAEIFANCPLRLRSGLLLYGFPGCGKTLLASAAAKECGLNFISVKGPELLNKYIGASEKAVRDLFERARVAKPCLLFFDEFDSIAPRRGHDSTGVTDRVVNQLLTEMDGAQGLEGVYVLAATSRPDLIDPALLRPGRLDKSILCDMPTEADRGEILRAVSRKLDLAPDVHLPSVAEQTEGFSGADLQAIMYNAHLEAVHESIDRTSDALKDATTRTNKGKGKGKGKAVANGHLEPLPSFRSVAPMDGLISDTETNLIHAQISAMSRQTNEANDSDFKPPPPKPIISWRHVLQALASTRPSVSHSDVARLQRMYQSFQSGRGVQVSSPVHGRETGTRVSLM